MSRKMVNCETFKHKLDTKTKETQMLLQRVEGLSMMNGDLQDQIEDKQRNIE